MDFEDIAPPCKLNVHEEPVKLEGMDLLEDVDAVQSKEDIDIIRSDGEEEKLSDFEII